MHLYNLFFSQCLITVLGLAATIAGHVAGGIEFEQPGHQPAAGYGYGYGYGDSRVADNYGYGYSDSRVGDNYGYVYDARAFAEADEAATAAVDLSPSSRTHHGKHKAKKLKKKLLLHCLLGGHGRRRRDAGTGRFILPIAVQSTNVNVGSGGLGGGGGAYGDPLYGGGGGGGGGCMNMLNNHGPLGLLGSPTGDSDSRSSVYKDWNRYARQFHRNFVRPLYRLF